MHPTGDSRDATCIDYTHFIIPKSPLHLDLSFIINALKSKKNALQQRSVHICDMKRLAGASSVKEEKKETLTMPYYLSVFACVLCIRLLE